MNLQPLTDDELPALPLPEQAMDFAPTANVYMKCDIAPLLRQAAEAQRLKSERQVAARIAELESENEAQAAEIARLHSLVPLFSPDQLADIQVNLRYADSDFNTKEQP